nr:hypothetical protein [Tanacetum cinerariifolium]
MNEAVKVFVQIQSDRLRKEAQRENDEFFRTVDENIKKIIKKQVKEQVKAQVSKILPRIEQAMNEQLEAEVLTRSSHSSRTSYAGRGLQGTLEVEDTHVTLTLVKPDGQQESSSVSSQFVTSMLNLTLDVGMESIFETTSRIDVQTPTSVAPLPITTPTMTSSTIDTTTPTSQAPTLPTTIPMKVFVQIQSDRLRKEAQRENDEFFRTLPRIEQAMNEQLEAEVLTRSSHSSRTSYAVAADLSEMELKKILIKRMEGNKSIQCSNEQKNLYKALVDAYESNKIILDTYGETVTLKRRRNDDEDKDEEPFDGPDRGSKRRKEGKEPESASAPSEIATKSIGRSTTGSRSRQASTSESAFTEEPVQTTSQIEEPSHPKLKYVQKINLLYNLLSILNGSLSHRNHQLWIVIRIRPCQLSTEAFNRG